MDYSGLKTRIIDTLSDAQVTDAKAGEFIEQAEPKLSRDMVAPGGTPRQMLARLVQDSDSEGGFDLPSDFYKARTVYSADSLMTYVSPEHVKDTSYYAETSVTLDYYQALPALSDTNTTNWLLQVAPDLYLYAACLQYQPYAQDDAYRDWVTFYNDAMASLKLAHGPQPQGGWASQKRNQPTGVYTIIGSKMYFASKASAP